jgi:hypothetical protein
VSIKSAVVSNAIFVHLAGRNRWFPSRSLLFLVFICECAATIFDILPRLHPIPGHALVRAMLVGWLCVIMLPPIIAAASALLVARASTNEQAQLLSLASISSMTKVQGYVTGVLYRLHLLFMVLAVLLPGLVTGMALVAAGAQAIRYLRFCPSNDVRCSPYIEAISALGPSLESALIHFFLWSLFLLAVNGGVLFGLLLRRHQTASAVVAAAIMLLVSGAAASLWHSSRWDLPSATFLLAHFVISAVVALSSPVVLRIARRWA